MRLKIIEPEEENLTLIDAQGMKIAGIQFNKQMEIVWINLKDPNDRHYEERLWLKPPVHYKRFQWL